MQSACDNELHAVHRLHDAAQVEEAVRLARKARIKNLSLDLIYGLPGQTMESWRKSVEAALSLKPEHLSCYGLKVEPGTPLDGRVMRGEQLPDDDLQADMYLWMVDRLTQALWPGRPLRLRRPAVLLCPGPGPVYHRNSGRGQGH